MLTNIEYGELRSSQSINKKWSVIHSKSRREKKIAHYSDQMGIKFYLPLEQRLKLYGRKKVKTSLPLFPGYIFCLADEKERYQLLMTHQIAKILDVSNQKCLLNDLEILFNFEWSGAQLFSNNSLIEGQKARIKAGPFRGIEGIISQIRGKYRLFLKVESINQIASVEINREHIEILN